MFGILKLHRSNRTFRSGSVLSEKEMERLLVKERLRCDRYQQYFSLVTVHFNPAPEISLATQEQTLVRLLAGKLRLIDDIGYLRKGGLGVLLPMTDAQGGRVVLEKILKCSEEYGLSIEADVLSYHGRKEPPNQDWTGDDTPSSLELEGEYVTASKGSEEIEQLEDRLQAFRSHWDAASTSPVNSQPALRMDSTTHSFTNDATELLKLCSGTYPIWKRQVDIVGATIGLAAGLPILLAAGLAIKLTSRGPILFAQKRGGQYGRPFVIYKLRTMSIDAEETKHLLHERNERDGPAFKIKNDPRVTRVGRFLRATGIDELPQLINVLKGDMAIVGPRPLPLAEEHECSPWQRRRLDTKPGITCLWQISKSRQMTFDEWMRLDLKYLRKRSPLYDASLILRTIKAVVTGRVGH
jgi:lipopolysaccharide/colanic/teichoic acid biosynthesis glycosyltransferase